MLRLVTPPILALSMVLTVGVPVRGDETAAAEPVKATPGPSTDVSPEAMRQALANATALVEQLRAELTESRARIATLERALREAGVEPDAERLAQEQTLADREAARQAEEQRRQKLLELREQREAEKRRERIEQALAPNWYYTWQIGYIDNGSRRTTFVKTGDDGTVVFVGDRTTIDRRQIILRGTFENTSRAPYRYTFEIRVAESGPYAFGLNSNDRLSFTRYQTPVLQPGELHRWEVKMTVDDALQVRTADIGNVRADPPPAEPLTTPPAAEPAEAAAGVETTGPAGS